MKAFKEVFSRFAIEGEFIDCTLYGSGHINDTYIGRYLTPAGTECYIHQHINHKVFQQPEKLMENVERVTSHLRRNIEAQGGDVLRETLNLVPTVDGQSFHVTPEGQCWRTYVFIEGARTYDVVEDRDMVLHAGRAFGRFQRDLADLPGDCLHEIIPDFHNTQKRFQDLITAVEQDAQNRAASVKKEIDFALDREKETSTIIKFIEDGLMPERITHNDTKINNVMIDDETHAGICVIDLDTVMPGSALYDFGDAVRSSASLAAEDEKDPATVGLDLELYDRLACGYLKEAREFLIEIEKQYLAFAAKLMTFECGLRFLSDYLQGDNYFRVHRADHNLERCRTQFALVQDMERKMEEMERVVSKYT